MKEKERGERRPMAALKGAFVGPGGTLRAPWLLALGYALDLGWAYAVSAGMTRGFSGLFSAWGLTSANLPLAPGWARWIVRNYGSVISVVSSLGIAALATLLVRAGLKERLDMRLRPKQLGLGALAGLGIAAVSALAFVLSDSMRLAHGLREARLSGELLTLLVVYGVAALAEELFDRAFVLRAVRAALGEGVRGCAAACAASALMLWLTTGAVNLGVIGSVNMLLFGGLCALLHWARLGNASWGLRFAWSYASVSLVAFPGGNTASAPWLELYHVSDALFTGGERGLICGLWMTGILALLLLILLLRMRRAQKED